MEAHTGGNHCELGVSWGPFKAFAVVTLYVEETQAGRLTGSGRRRTVPGSQDGVVLEVAGLFAREIN